MSDLPTFIAALTAFGRDGVAADLDALRAAISDRLAERLPGFVAGAPPDAPYDEQIHQADRPPDRTLIVGGARLALPDPRPEIVVATVVAAFDGEAEP